jgi:hyperosmotically inducible protein
MNTYNYISIRTLLMAAGLSAGLTGALPASAERASAPIAHSDSARATISDTHITAKVKLALAHVKSLRGSDVDVTTTNGVVTLTGTATGAHARSVAEKLTRDVDGVKDVYDEMTTPSSSKLAADTKSAARSVKHGVSDSWITTKVKSELLADSVTKGFEVKVVTTGGVVVLSGKLANKDAVAHVNDLVEKIDGVKSVDTSGIVVAAS